SFLVETLKRIHKTYDEQGAGALGGEKLKEAAKSRVFGFEILPAPFVVAHLQLGLLLQNLGVPLADENERVGVYLTNALTGWEPPKGPQKKLDFQELEEERDAAEHVKRDKPILVILGNPPYNAFAGASPQEEHGLVEPYKEGLVKEWKIKKFNLDDLYVRFFRLAERRIAEKTGRGVVCYISNFSYLGDPSFVVMRKRFLAGFDRLWFDCMNGDSRETGKVTPDGKPDPSVFSTEYNREGIRVGTAIGLMVRKDGRAGSPDVRFRHFWGADKRGQLVESLSAKDFESSYEIAEPEAWNYHNFKILKVSDEYKEWPKIIDLCAHEPYNGPVERRGMALISMDKDSLANRILAYFDAAISDDEIKKIHPSLMMTSNRIVGPDARTKIQHDFIYDESRIVHYPFKPMDVRWCYLENLRPLFSEPSPQLLNQRTPGNAFFITRDSADKDGEGIPFYFSSSICDYDAISGHARHVPMLINIDVLRKTPHSDYLHKRDLKAEYVSNISEQAIVYIEELGVNYQNNYETASLIWYHALAIGYSPLYLKENADGIKIDWPRIPLPNSKAQLQNSANLGKKIAALLDTEGQVPSVTTGKLRPELRKIAECAKAGGGNINLNAGEAALTAGWGHGGKDGITMPGKGKAVERDYTPEEKAAIEEGAKALGLTLDEAMEHLGETTYDIYLNDTAYWKDIPRKVWEYTIGGYQVMKKWLSYRERDLLGRALTADEITEVTNMARRIAAIVLLERELDGNYIKAKDGAYRWKGEGG
ncbi:MAG: DNA methyltransferase, partial [Nitrospirae bacterium]|nr:DNA methyltransferase [Nitrospirota bacterium]